MTFPPDTRDKTAPHGDPLRPDPIIQASYNQSQGDILWEMGPTFVESFLNPESLHFYIRQHDNDTCVILNISDLAAIVKAVVDRHLRNQFSDAPTGDDLPF